MFFSAFSTPKLKSEDFYEHQSDIKMLCYSYLCGKSSSFLGFKNIAKLLNCNNLPPIDSSPINPLTHGIGLVCPSKV